MNLTERSLVHGLLAFQLGFVQRNDLVQLLKEWAEDKSVDFGILLNDRASLGEDARQMLDALVTQHLKNHHDSIEQSLAALSSISSLHDELATIGDDELEASLCRIPIAKSSATSLEYSPPIAGTEQGRFRLVKLHAKGGLGQVSLAVDQQLSREVAVKELQSHFADDQSSRERFMVEAEITGALEHPGIVPVYGAGHYADGRPYYAMRFVRGDSLRVAIADYHRDLRQLPKTDSRRLELRKLLSRFIDVCEAIHYAHSRRVLHRDLKPGNIMLGRYGETLVVDWGLAKAAEREAGDESLPEAVVPNSSSGSHATRLGTTIGTPGYMSPEQAAGKIDQLGPASDVYSLGATLYCVLTGKAPFEGTSAENILSAVQTESPVPPSSINPDVAKSLDAVCLKAMQRLPESRYASARDLADDVERWLADEPVSVLREPFPMRALRWARHHRAAAATTLTAIVGVALTAVLVAALLADSNTKLAVKEAAAVAAKEEATEIALQNARLARQAQRETATYLHAEARRLLGSGHEVSGFIKMSQSMQVAPEEDSNWSRLIAGEVTAWSSQHMRALTLPSRYLELGETLGENRVAAYSNAAENEAFTSQIVDAETLQPVSDVLGLPDGLIQEFVDEEHQVYCSANLLSTEWLEVDQVEMFPAEMKLTTENRPRACAFESEIGFDWCRYPTGEMLEIPLRIKLRYYAIRTKGNESRDFVELFEQGLDDYYQDELIGLDFEQRILAVSDIVSGKFTFWSLVTGEEILPAGGEFTEFVGSGSQVAGRTGPREIDLYSRIDRAPDAHLSFDADIVDFDFSDDGSALVIATADRHVHVRWQDRSRPRAANEEVDADIQVVRMAGKAVVAVTESGTVYLWRAEGFSRRLQLLHSERVMEASSFSDLDLETSPTFLDEDGTWLQLQSEPGRDLRIWTSDQETVSRNAFLPPAPVLDTVGSTEDQAEISPPVEVLYLPSPGRLHWDYSQDSIVTWGEDGLQVHFLKYGTSNRIDFEQEVSDLRMLPGTLQFVTLDNSGRIRLWNSDGDLLAMTTEAPVGTQRTLAKPFFLSGRIVCLQERIGQMDDQDQSNLLLWKLPEEQTSKARTVWARSKHLAIHPLRNLAANSDSPVAFSQGGERLVTIVRKPHNSVDASSNDTQFAYDVFASVSSSPNFDQFENVLLFSSAFLPEICFLQFNPEGTRLAVGTQGYNDGGTERMEVRVIDLEQGSLERPSIYAGYDTVVWSEPSGGYSLELKPLGVVSGDLRTFAGKVLEEDDDVWYSTTWELWDLSREAAPRRLLETGTQVNAAVFSPDGKQLALGGQDGNLHIWDVASGERVHAPMEHFGVITGLHYTPDSSRIIVITSGTQWQIRSARTGETLLTINAIDSSYRRTSTLSPDGRILVTADANGRIQPWDLEFGVAVGRPLDSTGYVSDLIVGKDYIAVQTYAKWDCLPLWRGQSASAVTVASQLEVITTVGVDQRGIIRPLSADQLNQSADRVDQESAAPARSEVPELIMLR